MDTRVQHIIIDGNGDEFSLDVDPISFHEQNSVSNSSRETQFILPHEDPMDGNKTLKSTSLALGKPAPPRPLTSAKALLDGKFFSIVAEFYSDDKYQRKVRKIRAKCSMCSKPSYITCSTDSTSNFLRHIKLKHGKQMYEAYLAYKKSKSLNNSIQDFTNNTTAIPEILPSASIELPGQDKVQKLVERFETKLLKFMIDRLLPLSLVDTSSFRELFPEVLGASVSSTAVGLKIEESFNAVRKTIKTILSDIRYFCITVDVWTEKSNSFIGLTVHWVTDILTKHSAILSCSRIVDISFESAVNHMNEVFSVYNLNKEQMVAMVTDNGFYFANVFNNLKVYYSVVPRVNEVFQLTCSDFTVSEPEESTRVFDLQFQELEVDVELHSMLANTKNICYSLSSVATFDFQSLLEEYEVIARIHESAMLKCNSLWNACMKPRIREQIKPIAEHGLPYPCVSSWKSLYDALKALVDIRSQLPLLCEELKLEEFMPEELEYLETFVTVMHPIAAAIETLRSESVYFGCVLPTLLTIKMKLEEMSKSDSETITPVMAEHLLQAFRVRFDLYLNLDTNEICVRQAILAAVSHPKLKLRWISNPSKVGVIKRIFVEECSALGYETEATIEDVEDDDFFAACLQSNAGTSAKNEIKSSLELEVLRFLESKDKSMEMLNSYPNVKLVFLKYNSLLTSTQPVEKLFAFDTLLLRETTASAAELEVYLFLKGNSHISLV